jgi:hypothetical protein
MVGPDRTLALIRSDLDLVKEVAHAHAATVNDVLLAVTAGGLRALLRSRGEPVEATMVRIYVPVSLRRRVRGPQQDNLIAQMAVPLPSGGPILAAGSGRSPPRPPSARRGLARRWGRCSAAGSPGGCC